jgi:hypothetical protein
VVDRDAVAKAQDISVLVLGRQRRARLIDGGVLYDPSNSKLKA